MPNIKSAIKRVKVIEKKELCNRMIKSEVKTITKKFEAAVSQKNIEEATRLLPIVSGTIDSAAVKGIMHKNAANRKKAKLAIHLSKAKAE